MDLDIFAEMQMQTLDTVGVPAKRKQLNEIVAFFKQDPLWERYCTNVAKLRELKPETMMKADMFHIPGELPNEMVPEEYRHESCGLWRGDRCMQSGRATFPVKDVRGDVAGFCGWEWGGDPKYLDSRNYGYVAKETMLYGMEMLPKYLKDGYMFVTEGMMCMHYMRENNLNCMAKLGSYTSTFVLQVMKRFGKNCIQISDADEAGDKDRKMLSYSAPDIRVFQSTIAKDVDDSMKINPDILYDLQMMVDKRFYRPKYFV